jgi:hypothetical protein
MDNNNMIPLLVTTARGIYFGFAPDMERGPNSTKILYRMRHVFRYARRTDGREDGTWSLPKYGPAPGSKVAAEVTRVEIRDVYHIAECTSEAVEEFARSRWE